MLTLYQDTKISLAGVSFIIPKSFYIVVDDEFCPVKNYGLILTTQEKNCCIEVYTDTSDKLSNIRNDFLSIVCDENAYSIHGEVEERMENNMYSIRAEYESKWYSYFEMHIGQCKGYYIRVNLLITVKKNQGDIAEIMKREDVRQFIDSFEIAE